MIELIPCKARLDELVRFVAGLNSDGAHHIGFFGEGEADVRSALAECLIDPAEGFVLAYEEDQLVGAFGVDADAEIDRAWLFGPVVDHADWHEVADQLYAKVLPRIPIGIRDYDMFADVQNTRLEAFAMRHGFPSQSENAVLTLSRDMYRRSAPGKTAVRRYQNKLFRSFENMHKSLFPNAYFTARQMVEKLDEHHQLFLALEDRRLLGYHFCKTEPASGSGYIDFLGTDPLARGRGIGADLLAAGIDWMISAPATQRISLTVNADNTSALRLYEKFGFVTDRVMRGYRKQVA